MFPKVKILRSISLAALPFMASCIAGNVDHGSVYTVSQADFEEVIAVEGTVESVEMTSMAIPTRIWGTISFIVEDGIQVKKDDVVCIVKNHDLETELDDIKIRLENSRTEYEQLKAEQKMQYALLEAQVENNRADTKIASLDSLQLAYLSPSQRHIQEMELAKAKIESEKLAKKFDALKIIQRSDARKADMTIKRYETRLKATEDVLGQLTIKAPRDGLIIINKDDASDMDKPLTAGSLAWNGMPVAIMPDMGRMKVKMRVSETDYKAINAGDSVHYAFDAMPDNSGWGRITQKAPVGQPYKSGSKVKTFEIEASMEHVASIPEPGLSVECRIVVKRLPHAVTIPQITVFEQDSMKVVYLPVRRGYEMREIAAGISSPSQTTVAAGLAAGETILFSQPRPSQVKIRTLLPDSLKMTRAAETIKANDADDETLSDE